jgi:methyltransferase (TIGR00027 family)
LAWLRPALAARTRFFDDQVLSSIASGITQVVIVGAGYDDRALRFRTRGVTFFEIDHPATQDDKARRLRAMQVGTEAVVLAAADFYCDDVCSALASAGHDGESASLFICEGVLVYLQQETIVKLLTSLRACAGGETTLAASLATHGQGVSSEKVLSAANARRASGGVEPWRTILPADVHLELLARSGWQVERAIDAAELGEDVAEGRSLLVAARPLKS